MLTQRCLAWLHFRLSCKISTTVPVCLWPSMEMPTKYCMLPSQADCQQIPFFICSLNYAGWKRISFYVMVRHAVLLPTSTWLFLSLYCLPYTSTVSTEGPPSCPKGCERCSEYNGCIKCKPKLFIFLERNDIRQIGVCLASCPVGYFGMRNPEGNNRCTREFYSWPCRDHLYTWVGTFNLYVHNLPKLPKAPAYSVNVYTAGVKSSGSLSLPDHLLFMSNMTWEY